MYKYSRILFSIFLKIFFAMNSTILSKHLFLYVIAFAFSTSVFSQSINGRFSTSFYAWEKFDTVNVSQTILRAYQTAQLDVAQNDISLHSYFIGAGSSAKNFGDDGSVRINNLFLKYKNIANVADIKLGRIPYFAGVGNGIVDGAMMKANVSEYYSFALYCGANVPSSLSSKTFSDLDKNFVIGGQIVSTLIEDMRVSVSYVNKNVQRKNYTSQQTDSLYNLVNILAEPSFRYQQAASFDMSHASGAYSEYLRYDYDMNMKRTLRFQYGMRYDATEQLSVTAEFNFRKPRIPYNSFFAMFPVNTVREYEGGVEYKLTPNRRLYGKFAFVKFTDENSNRISVGYVCNYVNASFSSNGGYAGTKNSFSLQGTYSMLERTFIPSLGISYAAYTLEENGTQKKMFAGIFGAVIRPFPSLSFDAQVQILNNPVVNSDIRFLFKINYWFYEHLNFFSAQE